MKQLQFETSKGMFGLVDNPILPQSMSITTKYIKLSEITEEQASEIVDEFLFNANDGSDYGDQEVYKDYVTDEIYLTNPIESLHSLLKSKAIHLYENPFGSEQAALRAGYYEQWIKDNQNTYYNPYISKI